MTWEDFKECCEAQGVLATDEIVQIEYEAADREQPKAQFVQNTLDIYRPAVTLRRRITIR